MAECIRYECKKCGNSVEAWSDGNPYFINEMGKKQYAYHPDHENLAKCAGNDVPYLCLYCGKNFKVDSRFPDSQCPKCSSDETAATDELENRQCPKCKNGTFEIDVGFYAIS